MICSELALPNSGSCCALETPRELNGLGPQDHEATYTVSFHPIFLAEAEPNPQ